MRPQGVLREALAITTNDQASIFFLGQIVDRASGTNGESDVLLRHTGMYATIK